jgi:hypothetical protein
MIRVHCHTNLDLRNEFWPTVMPAVPQVGHEIASTTIWKSGFQLHLTVVAVRWRYMQFLPVEYEGQTWIPHIELHLSGQAFQTSIREFYNRYAPLIGTVPGAFI